MAVKVLDKSSSGGGTKFKVAGVMLAERPGLSTGGWPRGWPRRSATSAPALTHSLLLVVGAVGSGAPLPAACRLCHLSTSICPPRSVCSVVLTAWTRLIGRTCVLPTGMRGVSGHNEAFGLSVHTGDVTQVRP